MSSNRPFPKLTVCCAWFQTKKSFPFFIFASVIFVSFITHKKAVDSPKHNKYSDRKRFNRHLAQGTRNRVRRYRALSQLCATDFCRTLHQALKAGTEARRCLYINMSFLPNRCPFLAKQSLSIEDQECVVQLTGNFTAQAWTY